MAPQKLFKAVGMHMNKLEIMMLSLGTSVDDACLSDLTEHVMVNLNQLEILELALSGSQVSDKGVVQFYESGARVLKNVKIFGLALHGASVTDESLNTFVQKVLPEMTRLEKLYLGFSNTLITGLAVSRFFEEIPKPLRKLKTLKLDFNDCIRITKDMVKQIELTAMPILVEVECLEVQLPNLLIKNMNVGQQQ